MNCQCCPNKKKASRRSLWPVQQNVNSKRCNWTKNFFGPLRVSGYKTSTIFRPGGVGGRAFCGLLKCTSPKMVCSCIRNATHAILATIACTFTEFYAPMSLPYAPPAPKDQRLLWEPEHLPAATGSFSSCFARKK